MVFDDIERIYLIVLRQNFVFLAPADSGLGLENNKVLTRVCPLTARGKLQLREIGQGKRERIGQLCLTKLDNFISIKLSGDKTMSESTTEQRISRLGRRISKA